MPFILCCFAGVCWLIERILKLTHIAKEARGEGTLKGPSSFAAFAGRSHEVVGTPQVILNSAVPEKFRIDGRIFLSASLTIDNITSEVSHNNDFKNKTILDSYAGKWMCLRVTVSSISSFSGKSCGIFAHSGERASLKTCIFIFGQTWTEQVSVLPIGDQITIIGQIREASNSSITFDHCEIVP